MQLGVLWRYLGLFASALALATAPTPLLASGPAPAPAVGGAADEVHITQAEFRAEGAASAVPVRLPHSWPQRGLPAGAGEYRLRFTLPTAVTTVWAVEAERLSTSHELRLNGHLVHGSLEPQPPFKRPQHMLVALPPHLLRAGENTLDIRASSAAGGGLSALRLGPAEALADDFRRSQLRHVALPQIANIAAGGVAFFIVLMWWRRRSEVALGAFGALCLLASVRNYGYFVTGGTLPSPWSSWLYMQAALLTALLLGIFAMAHSGHRPAVFRRALWATSVLFPLLSLGALAAGALQLARLWLYPVLLLLVLAALVLLLRAALRRRAPFDGLLSASLVGVLAAAVHDYLYQQGWLSIMDTFWTPYAVPVVVAVFAASLLKRLLMSLEVVERLNVTLERKVAERTRELQDAHAATTRFLAAASHDLRQPMLSIGLLVGMVDEQVGAGPLRRVVQKLQEATAAMDGLLTRLLDLSRLQSGTVRVQRQALALQPLFEAVAAQHGALAQRKGLRLRLRAGGAAVCSDVALLEQIVGNLAGNAVRYTQQGGVLLGVRPAGPAHWRVEVWDSGPGIAPEAQATLFDEFVRGPAHNPGEVSVSGLGLGLAIVKRSAALLGTEVVLRSAPGRGSCFSVLLPRAAAPRMGLAAAPAHEPGPHHRPSPPSPPALAGHRLWLLEDDPHARAALQLQLQHWGAEVLVLHSLKALRDADTATRPDMLITDRRLPDGQGSDALQHLRQRWPGLPALLVTGDTAPEDLVALASWREAGVQVLLKPFHRTALLAAVQRALAAPTA